MRRAWFWRTPARAVAAMILVTAGMRVLAAGSVGLGNGESYYFSCARHVALSYFDNPPLGVWLGALAMRAAGGAGPLVLRLPFIALFAGTTWLCFALTRRLWGARAGLYAAVALNLAPVFTLSTACFFQPDGALALFMLACAYFLARVLAAPSPARPTWLWLGAGASLGLAILAKYHALSLVPAVGVFLLTRADRRGWLRRPGPYLALAVAAAVCLPVWIWNARHGWVSFRWQGARGLWTGLHADWLGRNLLGQATWLWPWIMAALLWQLVRCFRAGRADAGRWLIAWLAVGPIVAFTAISAWAPIGMHFHWQAPGYLLLMAPLGEAVRVGLERRRGLTRLWLGGSLAAVALAFPLLLTHARSGWWRELGPRWGVQFLGASDDPTLEMLDYDGLSPALAERGLLQRKDLFVFTPRWFLSGKVDYALRGALPVTCLQPQDPRAYAFFYRPRDWLGADGLLVASEEYSRWPLETYGPYFRQIVPLGEVPIRRAGRTEITLHLYLCRDYLRPFPVPYR